MGKCSICGESDGLTRTCNYCGRKVCSSHTLPENHNCPSARPANKAGKHFESSFEATLDESSKSSRENSPKSMDKGKIRTYGTEKAVENLDSSPPVRTKSDDDRLDEELDRIQEEKETSVFVRAVSTILTPFLLVAFFLRRLFSARVLLVLALGVATAGQLGAIGVPGFPVDLSPAEDAVDDAGAAVANGTSTTAADREEASGQAVDGLNRTQIERLVHEEINNRRRAHDLRPLQFDVQLRETARYHSRDMAENKYFAHDSPSGETMGDRYEKHGYDCQVDTSGNQYMTGAENIAMTYAFENILRDNGDTAYYTSEEEIAVGLTNQWMNSTGHRENILQSYWQSEGIGVSIMEIDGKTRIYATQNFC